MHIAYTEEEPDATETDPIISIELDKDQEESSNQSESTQLNEIDNIIPLPPEEIEFPPEYFDSNQSDNKDPIIFYIVEIDSSQTEQNTTATHIQNFSNNLVFFQKILKG